MDDEQDLGAGCLGLIAGRRSVRDKVLFEPECLAEPIYRDRHIAALCICVEKPSR
jgi:hypothetical protein